MPKLSPTSVSGDTTATSWQASHTPANARRKRCIAIRDILTKTPHVQTPRRPDRVRLRVSFARVDGRARAGLDLVRRRERVRRRQRPAAAVRRIRVVRIAELV